MRRLLPLLLVLAPLACSSSSRGEEKATVERSSGEKSAEAPADAEPAKAEHPANHPPMIEHFQQAARIRDAVIAGELEDLREPARWLAEEMKVSEYPEGWRAHVEHMQREAQGLVAAQEIGEAAAKAASLAAVCGECHRALGVGPRPEVLDPPDRVEGVVPHMMRHQWAAERMWEGLIAPSDKAWARGAEVLAESPMHAEDLTENVELPEEIVALRNRVHELAGSGKAVREPAHRAALYGEFLASCATCHKGGC